MLSDLITYFHIYLAHIRRASSVYWRELWRTHDLSFSHICLIHFWRAHDDTGHCLTGVLVCFCLSPTRPQVRNSVPLSIRSPPSLGREPYPHINHHPRISAYSPFPIFAPSRDGSFSLYVEFNGSPLPASFVERTLHFEVELIECSSRSLRFYTSVIHIYFQNESYNRAAGGGHHAEPTRPSCFQLPVFFLLRPRSVLLTVRYRKEQRGRMVRPLGGYFMCTTDTSHALVS